MALLKWSTQLSVSPPALTQKLSGDKILLPPSALEQLLAASPAVVIPANHPRPLTSQFDPFNPYTFAAERRARELVAETQRQLPHPLTFRLVNPSNGRVIHAGIREFSAPENEIGLSPLLRESLGFQDSDFETQPEDEDTTVLEDDTEPASDDGRHRSVALREGYPRVTVHAVEVPKGTFVRLRPLESGYDVEDWKALLERYLRDNFTTLTLGEVLPVSVGRTEVFRFLVDKIQPEGDAICVIDTDLEVDIEPLDEEQARESLRRRLEKNKATGGSSTGGKISPGQDIEGQVLPGNYVDYEVHDWDRDKVLNVELTADANSNVDVLVSPFSPRQRSRPRLDEHVFGELSNESVKRICLRPTNVELEGAEALYMSVHRYSLPDADGMDGEAGEPSEFRLRVDLLETTERESSGSAHTEMHDADEVQCKNCQQWVPKRTLFLHENFCLRNNVLCSKCNGVFQRRSPEWENHWHCPHDDAHGNDVFSKLKHETVFHSEHDCPACDFQAKDLPDLARHRTTTCPAKLILCQFCHLLVPQKGEQDPDFHDPEVLLSGLTPHELVDGARTTECHLCNKIIRLRDMKTHLRHHELDRVSRPPPRICINPNCCRTVDGKSASNNALGICTACFGPLYADLYDPEGKALRRRIERRYLSQMLTGCGKPWCRNEYCKTGRANLKDLGSGIPAETPALAPKDALALIKPLVDAISVSPGTTNTAPLHFCTDESTQRRRTLANLLSAEQGGFYECEWCVAAVEFGGGDLDKARQWLTNWAPKKGER